MDTSGNTKDTQPQPVAYDADGRPLYYHPEPPAAGANPPAETPAIYTQDTPSHVNTRPEAIEGHNFNPQIRSQYANEPKVVHSTREYEPKAFNISDDLKRKHEESAKNYPFLNLSEAEYVILDIKRHPIGMLIPIGVTLALVFAILAFVAIYPSISSSLTTFVAPDTTSIFGIAMLVIFGVVLGGAAVLWVYLQNQFFMTNESVIQEIQDSLFSRHEQTVSLGSIEDASFRQSGILQLLFNYGTIRLSTEGEETTYIFRYVANPKKQIAILNNAIEAFKNGRPVCDD